MPSATPASPLRRIAVFVDEPEPGRFQWVLIESAKRDETWAPLKRDRTHHKSYQAAMSAGLQALQALVGDLDKGPRAPQASASRRKAEREADADAADAPVKSAYFGFGPVR